MTERSQGGRWWRTSIRTRLAVVLSLALAPVLLLSVAQSVLIFHREATDQQAELVGAVERSAATVRARIASAGVLLRSLEPVSTGAACASGLADIKDRIPGYANLIRFDPSGNVVCAASATPSDPDRGRRSWFRSLVTGSRMTVTSEDGAAYAGEPSVLASVRTQDSKGRQTGVLTGVITLASLRPARDEQTVPVQAEAALVDGLGRYLSTTRIGAFPPSFRLPLAGRTHRGAQVWSGRDMAGERRIFAMAPLTGVDMNVVLSAPTNDVVAWAWLNPLSAFGLPVLAFGLALAGVWIVADRGLVQWIAYLQRIAAIYARGRFGVHPRRAAWAAPEIRGLADSLDAMAATISARDRALRESLVQKDGLLREIHHRVKNNLQVISSLLSLQQRGLTDPAARAALSDTRQRIAALALIYRALYEGPDLRKVILRDFLEELTGLLLSGDGGARPSVRTSLTVDAVAIEPDHLAPLALFAVEAIAEARKHGLSEPGGCLDVAFKVQAGNAELTISARGPSGVPPGGPPEGMGHTLMTAFARQLHGEVAYSPGAVTLTFPALGSAAAE